MAALLPPLRHPPLRPSPPGHPPPRPWPGLVFLALALVLPSALPSPLPAQARRPLTPSHWSYAFQEALHALGSEGSEFFLARSASGSAHLLLMEAVREAASPELLSFLEGWDRRLRREVGPWDRFADENTPLGAGLLLDGEVGWEEDPSRPVPDAEGFGRILLAGELGPGVTFWTLGEAATGKGGKAVQSAGLAVPAGSFDLALGRVPVALGQGTDPLLMNGRKPTSGAFLTSRVPLRLPGALEALGPFRLHTGFSPFVRAPGASSAWLWSFGLEWSPHPRLKLGALRTTRFAGEGIEPFRLQDFFRMLVGKGKADSFDDSQGEVAARVRWSLLGQPLATYASLGFEDKTTLWRDPGLLLGVLLPRLRSEGLYTFRYEFQAFGPRARWCRGCEEWEGDLWYLHPYFGPYVLEGEPLGSLLGGNGAAHTARLELWLSRVPLRGWLEHRRLSRTPENAMRDPAPRPPGSPSALEGWTLLPRPAPARVKSWALGAEAFLRDRWGVSGALRTALLDGDRSWALSLALRVLAGGKNRN